MIDSGYIERNYNALLAEIKAAAGGRKIDLVAVTKSGSDEELLALAALGVTDIGENRPQELRRRGELLAAADLAVFLAIGNYVQSRRNNPIHFLHRDVGGIDQMSHGKEITCLSNFRPKDCCGKRLCGRNPRSLYSPLRPLPPPERRDSTESGSPPRLRPDGRVPSSCRR